MLIFLFSPEDIHYLLLVLKPGVFVVQLLSAPYEGRNVQDGRIEWGLVTWSDTMTAVNYFLLFGEVGKGEVMNVDEIVKKKTSRNNLLCPVNLILLPLSLPTMVHVSTPLGVEKILLQ